MRVLLIDVNCKGSSTGKIVYDLYSHINSHGDEAAICFGRGKKINEKDIYKFGLDAETYSHALLTRLTGFTGCFSFFSTKRLIKFIKDFKPDIVHIHELHAYFVNINMLLSYLAKHNIKVIHTLHCEFSYTGKCGHSVECEKWKTECNNCPRIKEYISTLFFDQTKYMFRQKKRCFGLLNSLTIVTPSNWLLNRAKESFFSNRNIVLIYNGIDTSVFKPHYDTDDIRNNLGFDKEKDKVILALAPNLMSEDKGGIYVKKLAQMAQKDNIKFVFIGCANETIRTEDNCTYIGPIYDKRLLAKYYSIANAFVICSKRENFPTTCLEAQCCGTPIFGFDTGGTKETDVSGFSLFSEYKNMNDLYNNMIDLLFNRKITREDISRMAQERYSSNVMCNNYLKVYMNA